MDIRESSDLAAAGERHFWETARFFFLSRLLKRYAPHAKTILDVGCGDCFVLSSLAYSHPDATLLGVDPALQRDAIVLLKRRFPENAAVTLATDFRACRAAAPAELILLLDVLEHVENEETFLRELSGVLDDAGIVVVTVPAFQCLFSDHDVFLHHFRRYNRRQLCEVLSRSGFQVLTSGYLFHSLLLCRLLQKLLRRPAAGAQALQAGNPLFNRLFAFLLEADALFTFGVSRLGLPFPGLSCAAVVRKANRTG